MLQSYASIYNLGHKLVKDLLSVPVNVEEKVDGSQFSFGIDEQGEIHVRSKAAHIDVCAPERMFALAVQTVNAIAPLLRKGWTYRAEYLRVPKHNTLAYTRIPRQTLIIFDINTAQEAYLPFDDKVVEAKRIGLECVPLLYSGKPTLEIIQGLLKSESILGGTPIEGVVIKPCSYDMWGPDKHVLMGKYVSEAFKEIHTGAWRTSNPTKADIIDRLGKWYGTQQRWQKAVQHLAERGALLSAPQDIGNLLKEVADDVCKEEQDAIKQALWDWAWPLLRRRVATGLPEWYKEQLLKKQFENTWENEGGAT